VSGVLTEKATISAVPLDVAAGHKIDLTFGPNQTYAGASFNYRARFAMRGRGTRLCP
jgi:hypothetical protein